MYYNISLTFLIFTYAPDFYAHLILDNFYKF